MISFEWPRGRATVRQIQQALRAEYSRRFTDDHVWSGTMRLLAIVARVGASAQQICYVVKRQPSNSSIKLFLSFKLLNTERCKRGRSILLACILIMLKGARTETNHLSSSNDRHSTTMHCRTSFWPLIPHHYLPPMDT